MKNQWNKCVMNLKKDDIVICFSRTKRVFKEWKKQDGILHLSFEDGFLFPVKSFLPPTRILKANKLAIV